MTNIILGSTKHARFKPKNHSFSYPLYMLETDITKLDSLNKKWLTGYNKRNFISIYDKDHLALNSDSIPTKINKLIKQFKNYETIKKTTLVTIPRLFFKTFRPVCFYVCYDQEHNIVGMFAEVTNTYKESYYYQIEKNGSGQRMTVNKQFHVSPFFQEKGEYEFNIIDTTKQFEVHINYICDNEKVFYANFTGKKKKFNAIQKLKLLICYPFTSMLVFPRIIFQAFQLSIRKKIKHWSKPELTGKNTLRTMPLSFIQQQILNKFKQLCNQLSSGQLTLILPDKTTMILGKSTTGTKATIAIQNNQFFNDIQSGGEMGLGESFMNKKWTSPSVENVISYMIENKKELESKFDGSLFSKTLNVLTHRLRRNSQQNSKKNIAEHYDLGNSFYKLFLDNTMMYSSGLFLKKTDSLELSQIQKVNRLIDHLNLKTNDHILEIGSGWGYVAIEIAKKYQCKVTSITLSNEQYTLATQRVKKNNVEHLVTIELRDYRTISNMYDAIISVEMIEAVGHEYLSTYFERCNAILKPGGRFALQCITTTNENYESYTNSTDFIRKHIFPGGHLPCLAIIDSIIKQKTSLKEIHSLNIADSYAKTLCCWRHTFLKEKKAIHSMGFNETFFRKWMYYFSYCEAGFNSNVLGCYQLHFEKDKN